MMLKKNNGAHNVPWHSVMATESLDINQFIGSEREKHVFRLQKLDQIYYRALTN
jgi:hypothetical protein